MSQASTKKMKRPPPVETNPSAFLSSGFRGFSLPQQQPITIMPAFSVWTVAEQKELDRVLRSMSSTPKDSFLVQCTTIAAHLPGKLIRDVAFRLKLMESQPTIRVTNDPLDAFLPMSNEIIEELSRLISLNRPENREQILKLMNEFAGIIQTCKQDLDARQVRIPTAMLALREFPAAAAAATGISKQAPPLPPTTTSVAQPEPKQESS